MASSVQAPRAVSEKIANFASMNEAQKGISVVINTRNAADVIEPTLRSASGFEEILVCDMESIDATCGLAEAHGARVITFPYEGQRCAEPARDFAIRSAACEWVLVVDADEVITPELRAYLYDRITRGDCPDGLWLPRKNHLLGQWIHGTYPDYQLRFFRRDKTTWPPFVHTMAKVDGRQEHVPARRHDLALVHASAPLHAVAERINRYTDDELRRRPDRGVSLWKLIVKPWFRFVRSYILRGGFRDGVAGYVAARNEAIYKYFQLAKQAERHRQGVSAPEADKEDK